MAGHDTVSCLHGRNVFSRDDSNVSNKSLAEFEVRGAEHRKAPGEGTGFSHRQRGPLRHPLLALWTATHPSTNRARRGATTLINANALPLSQTATA